MTSYGWVQGHGNKNEGEKRSKVSRTQCDRLLGWSPRHSVPWQIITCLNRCDPNFSGKFAWRKCTLNTQSSYKVLLPSSLLFLRGVGPPLGEPFHTLPGGITLTLCSHVCITSRSKNVRITKSTKRHHSSQILLHLHLK